MPARRTYIPKQNGKKRPLGMPTWSDKLLAEVIRMILNAFYEPGFSDHSHGFRPGRGCHTALRDISYHWPATSWFIEGDIADCFGSLSHELLVSTLSERIHEGRFLALICKLLDAGYLEDWKFNRTLSGVPQGSVVSPILANILLNQLDTYVETVLIPHDTKGETRRENPAYRKLINRAYSVYKRGRLKEAQEMRKKAQRLPSNDPNDPEFRRLRYCRYADDFCLSFIGPKSEAEEIKGHLETFLREELKLELSKAKTLITHAKSEAARFLGYHLTILQENTKHSKIQRGMLKGVKRRSINGRVGLRVPPDVIRAKCDRYKKAGKPIQRGELLNESDYAIIVTSQLEFRGIANYYRLAYNLHALDELKQVMELSLAKTLANKHHISVTKVYDTYQAEQVVNGTTYKVLRAVVPRKEKPPLVAIWGAIPLSWDIQANLEDQTHQVWLNRTEIEQRLCAQTCEMCGATRRSQRIEVHHIRAMKDLNQYTGRDKPKWVQIMAARRRKTLVLCRTCHLDIHQGRPVRRQLSSS